LKRVGRMNEIMSEPELKSALGGIETRFIKFRKPHPAVLKSALGGIEI